MQFIVLGMVYYGISFGADKLGVDPFVYMAVNGVVEIPSGTVTIPLVGKLGRRLSCTLSFVVTAGSLMVLGFIPSGQEYYMAVDGWYFIEYNDISSQFVLVRKYTIFMKMSSLRIELAGNYDGHGGQASHFNSLPGRVSLRLWALPYRSARARPRHFYYPGKGGRSFGPFHSGNSGRETLSTPISRKMSYSLTSVEV